MTWASSILEALGTGASNVENHVPAAPACALHQQWLDCCSGVLFFSCGKLCWVVVALVGVNASSGVVLCYGSFTTVHSSGVLSWGVQVVLSGGAQSRSTRSCAPVSALLASCGLREDKVIVLNVLVRHWLLMYAVVMLVLDSFASSTRCCLSSRSWSWWHDLILLSWSLIHRPSCLRYGVNNQVHHITLLVHLVQCPLCAWVVWSDRWMRFENSDGFWLGLLEALGKLAFQIGLLWIWLLSIHVLLMLLQIHILELAYGIMPLMIAWPCALQPSIISRLQYPRQVPLLRGIPLLWVWPCFSTLVCSMRSTL